MHPHETIAASNSSFVALGAPMWPRIFDEFHDMQPLQPEKHVTKRRSYFATQLSRRAFLACLCCRSSKQKALAGGRTPEDLRIEHKDLIRGTLPASAHAVYAARSRHASVPVHSNAQFRSFDCDRVRKSKQDHNFIRQSTSRCLGGPSKRSLSASPSRDTGSGGPAQPGACTRGFQI